MQEPKIPSNEMDRIKAICGMHILDSPAEDRFDRITRLAAKYFSVPAALFTIVDVDRQWFKSRYGVEISETPRRVSFCGHVVYKQDMLIVEDASQDERFSDNPLVVEGPKIRFYAGQPIYTSDGYIVGSLCVFDTEPRLAKNFDSDSLVDFSKLIERELHNKSLKLETITQSRELDAAMQKLIKHIDNSPLAVIEWDRSFQISKWSMQAENIFGWKSEEMIGRNFQDWNFIHEDDVTNVRSALSKMIQSKGTSSIIHNKNYTKNGSIVNCTWYNSVLFDESGAMLSVLSLVQDETARVTAENKLLQSNIELENRVRIRTIELEEKQAMLDVILDSIEVGIVACDSAGNLTLFNRATRKLHGLNKASLSQEQWAEHYRLLALDGSRLLEVNEIPLARAFNGETVHNQQFVIECADGSRRIVNASGQRFSDSQGNMFGAVIAMHDITEQKVIELELLAKQALLRSITDSIPAGVAYVDKDERYQYCNQQYHQIYHKQINSIVGKTKQEAFSSSVYKYLEPFIKEALSGQLVVFERQHIIENKIFHLDVRFIPDKSADEGIRGFYVVLWDITEQKNRETEYKRQASLDPLTGIYNKKFIIELLEQEIKTQHFSKKKLAIMFLDIDYFKKINDVHGHLIGDEVIKIFASIIKSSIRQSDYVGRFGGDEFLLIIPNVDSLASVERIAEKILKSVATPVRVGGVEITLSTSIGIGFSNDSTYKSLIQLADEAVYEAKAAGRGNYKSRSKIA